MENVHDSQVGFVTVADDLRRRYRYSAQTVSEKPAREY